jgi:hypothetical protein
MHSRAESREEMSVVKLAQHLTIMNVCERLIDMSRLQVSRLQVTKEEQEEKDEA